MLLPILHETMEVMDRRGETFDQLERARVRAFERLEAIADDAQVAGCIEEPLVHRRRDRALVAVNSEQSLPQIGDVAVVCGLQFRHLLAAGCEPLVDGAETLGELAEYADEFRLALLE